MSTLHIRSVPEDLYRRIQALAKQKNRSLTAQVITLLEQAVENENQRANHADVLRSIQRRRFKLPVNAPNSLELLNEDRSR